jgi:hypothetical protein
MAEVKVQGVSRFDLFLREDEESVSGAFQAK